MNPVTPPLTLVLRDEVERHLGCQLTDDRDEQSSEHQFRFRLARMDGVRNPYRELIPRGHHGNVCRFVEEAAQSKKPLAVQLCGGLGDQLELLSLVLPWGSRHNVPLRLMARGETLPTVLTFTARPCQHRTFQTRFVLTLLSKHGHPVGGARA